MKKGLKSLVSPGTKILGQATNEQILASLNKGQTVVKLLLGDPSEYGGGMDSETNKNTPHAVSVIPGVY